MILAKTFLYIKKFKQQKLNFLLNLKIYPINRNNPQTLTKIYNNKIFNIIRILNKMIILEKNKITLKILSKNIEIKIIFMKMIINFKEAQVKRA